MVDIENVREKLLGSCNIMFGNEDITQNQYDLCLKNVDNKSNQLLNRKEKDIFNEIRSFKSSSSIPLLNSEQNKLFSEIRNKTNVLPGLFLQKICDHEAEVDGQVRTMSVDEKEEFKENLMNILSKIKTRLYKIILERNSTKENSDYYTTLNLYNKIDNNRLVKNKINEDIVFLLEKERINTNKLNDVALKSKTIGIVVLTLVLIGLLVFYLI